jgi:insulysin
MKVEETKIIKSRVDPLKYKFITLKNQLKCTLVYDTQTVKCSAVMSVGVGHMEDTDDCYGLAHFLEHMLFMGESHFLFQLI